MFYNSEGEETEKSLDVLNPSCYNETNELIENIDEFIHVGGHKWDVIFYDGDPLYNIEYHFQLIPSPLSYVITTNPNIWKQGDDIIAYLLPTSKDEFMQFSHDDFKS